MFKYILMCIWFGYVSIVFAQDRLDFDKINIEDGLSHISVLDIIQDSKGFIWVGTQFGLNRYDGYSFEVFNFDVEDDQSISSDFVLSIFEDSTGLIWVGTSNGLNSYNPSTTKFKRYLHDETNQNSITNDHITSITEDSLGYIWIGTAGGGVNRLNKQTDSFENIRIKFKNNQLASFITAMLIDTNGILWVACGNARLRPSIENGGIFNVNTLSLSAEQIIPQIESKDLVQLDGINSIFEDNDNNLWFGTLGQGLLKKAAGTTNYTQHFSKLISKQNTVLDITQDQDGNLWIATQYSGLFKLNTNTLKYENFNPNMPTKTNLNDRDITSLLIDSTGILWLGTWTDGINRLDFDKFQFKKYLQHETNIDGTRFQILGINQDSKGSIWLAAWENGLLEFDSETATFSKHQIFEKDNLIIRSIYVDRDDGLWLGTNEQGLIYYNPVTKEFINYIHDINDVFSISNNQIIDIISEPSGNLWIATRGGGVNYFDQGANKFYAYDKKSSNIDNRISILFYDDQDMLWIGTDQGLYIFDSNTKNVIYSYQGNVSKGNFNGKQINDIYQDSKKRMWLGTDKGFFQVMLDETGDWEKLVFKRNKDFLIGSVGGILEDPENNLWISGFKKIFKFNPESNQLTSFDSSHGVLHGGYYIGSSHIDNENTLYFGGLNGFTSFQAKDIYKNLQKPTVELTKLLLFNNPVKVNDSENSVLKRSITNSTSIDFNYEQNVFSLEFSALHYASSIDNKYAYKLVGFDNDWYFTNSSNRRATYTNLDPGKYHFYLKASNKDGVWSDATKKLSITIHAAPWETKWAYLSYFIILSGIIGSFIWLRTKQLQAIKLRNEQLSLTSKLFENTSECVWLLDHEFKYLAVNEGFCQVTGVNKNLLIGKKILPATIEGKQDETFIKNIFKIVEEKGYWSGEIWDQRINGEVYPAEIVIDRISIKNKKKNTVEYQYVGVFSDITKRKQTEEDLRTMAYFDPLTGLTNRSHFKILVQQEIDLGLSPGEFIIFYFDLDNFKDINDSLGHSHGDSLLIIIADRLQKLYDKNYTVARLGGDEFAIMIPNDEINVSTTQLSLNFSQEILKAINEKIELKGYNNYITASIGVSVYPYDGNNHEDLLRNADTAMYHAKKRGRNAAVLFSKSMNDTAIERLMLVEELNNAIKENEITPYYQPKVCLKTGNIKGVEVLARWNNKNLGIVPPIRFIPVAEESKLITEISEQLMIKAYHFILPVIKSGQFNGRISFNVSMTQFIRGDFVSWIDKILGECNFPSEYLELEITESMVMENIDRAIKIMKQLKSRNISISIDDFGTGYSSLSYLKKFPIDIIKIDKSFISDLMYSEEDRKIITSIIQLAHNLGLQVIAEGTEELNQVMFLKELNCEQIQGFYYCKPLPASEYLSFLTKNINLYEI